MPGRRDSSSNWEVCSRYPHGILLWKLRRLNYINLLIIQQIIIENLLCLFLLGGHYIVMTKANINFFHEIFSKWEFFCVYVFPILVLDGKIYTKSGAGLKVWGERNLLAVNSRKTHWLEGTAVFLYMTFSVPSLKYNSFTELTVLRGNWPNMVL